MRPPLPRVQSSAHPGPRYLPPAVPALPQELPPCPPLSPGPRSAPPRRAGGGTAAPRSGAGSSWGRHRPGRRRRLRPQEHPWSIPGAFPQPPGPLRARARTERQVAAGCEGSNLCGWFGSSCCFGWFFSIYKDLVMLVSF